MRFWAVSLFFILLMLGKSIAAEITVGGLNFPPYILKADNGKLNGVMIDLIREIDKRSSHSFNFKIKNWARSLEEAKRGRVDTLIPTTFSEERTAFLAYPKTPLVYLDAVLFQKKGRDFAYDGSMESLKGLTIGRFIKAKVAPRFDAVVDRGIFTVEERASIGQLMNGLKRDRLDLVGMDRVAGLWTAHNLDIDDDIEVLTPELGSFPVFLSFSRAGNAIEHIDEIDNLLVQMNADGSVWKVIQRYIE